MRRELCTRAQQCHKFFKHDGCCWESSSYLYALPALRVDLRRATAAVLGGGNRQPCAHVEGANRSTSRMWPASPSPRLLTASYAMMPFMGTAGTVRSTCAAVTCSRGTRRASSNCLGLSGNPRCFSLVFSDVKARASTLGARLPAGGRGRHLQVSTI